MERDRFRAQFRITGRPPVVIVNHEVDIKRNGRNILDSANHLGSESQIRNEVIVHHINVDEVGVTDVTEVSFHVDEIGTENARIDADGHGVRLSRSLQQLDEHRVRPVAMWPQLDRGSSTDSMGVRSDSREHVDRAVGNRKRERLIEPGEGAGLRTLMLAGATVVAAALWWAIVVVLAAGAGKKLRRPGVGKRIDVVTGVLLVGLGAFFGVA